MCFKRGKCVSFKRYCVCIKKRYCVGLKEYIVFMSRDIVCASNKEILHQPPKPGVCLMKSRRR